MIHNKLFKIQKIFYIEITIKRILNKLEIANINFY
jgi:hypothetical protein